MRPPVQSRRAASRVARAARHGMMAALAAMVVCAAAHAADPVAAGPLAVAPNDPHLQYVGRFDTRDPAGPRCEWPACTVTVRLRGTGLRVLLAESGEDFYQVVVDGRPTAVLHPGHGEHWLDVAAGLPDGEHVVSIVKRTEALVGRGQFKGFELPAGGVLLDPPAAAARRIEVIGDSISCGFGNEGPNENAPFAPATENAYLAYGAVAARGVGADCVCVAWSGKKLWPDNTLPALYDRALPNDPASVWAFTAPPPDAVLINLATNDFGPGIPDRDGWTAAYVAFVRRVREHSPKAMIYLASGSMMSDNWPPGQQALTTLKAYLAQVHTTLTAAGDSAVRVIHFEPQNAKADGVGAAWHPSVATHAKMAAVLSEALARDLGWRPEAPATRP